MACLVGNCSKIKLKLVMIHYKQHNTLETLPNKEYHGYLWFADCEFPEVIDGFLSGKLMSRNNTFIVEGNLMSKDNLTSVSIKQVGSTQFIMEFNHKDISEDRALQFNDLTYIPHKLPGFKEIVFRQVWIAESDENCCNWPTYRPRFQYFVELKKD